MKRESLRPPNEHPTIEPPTEPRFSCLIVDHGRKNQRDLSEMLRGLELQVIAADDATAALRALRSRQFDLVIAEEQLLGTPGTALLQVVQHFWPGTGRILIGQELGSDEIIRAVNRARVHRVLYKTMSLHSQRGEVEAVLNEVLLARSRAPGSFDPPFSSGIAGPDLSRLTAPAA